MQTTLNLKENFTEEVWIEDYVNEDGLFYKVKNTNRVYFTDHFSKMYHLATFRERLAYERKMPCGDRYLLISK